MIRLLLKPNNRSRPLLLLLPQNYKITNMTLPGCDLIPHVPRYCLDRWQDIWSNYANNKKLFAIYQHVGSAGHNKSLTRHEAATCSYQLFF